VNCHEFRSQIVHFQADELPAEIREPLQAHLDGCPDCARRLEVEDALLRGLKARLRREPAPSGLETRIRAALEDVDASTGRPVPWFRRPVMAALAAAVLLTLLIVPGLGTDGLADWRDGAVRISGLEVMVVDRDCDVRGVSLALQRKCRDPKHLNALKLADGTYWTVSLDQEDGREILLDAAMRGRRMIVEGDLFPRIHTLHLSRFEMLAETARLAAVPAPAH
jgi:anti-sigma factor (TIGR02949 family)